MFLFHKHLSLETAICFSSANIICNHKLFCFSANACHLELQFNSLLQIFILCNCNYVSSAKIYPTELRFVLFSKHIMWYCSLFLFWLRLCILINKRDFILFSCPGQFNQSHVHEFKYQYCSALFEMSHELM